MTRPNETPDYAARQDLTGTQADARFDERITTLRRISCSIPVDEVLNLVGLVAADPALVRGGAGEDDG